MYFVIHKHSPGRYWWTAVASGNHQTLATSEILDSKHACLHAIQIIVGEASTANYHDLTKE